MRRSTLIVVLISLIFILFVFYSLLHLEPLKVSGEHLEHLGDTVVVRGTVVNTGSNPLAAGLKVQFFDGAGHRLAEQTLGVGNLGPGRSAAFASQPVNAPKAEKFTIQVDHGSNMYGN
jgi:hypothetical protein